MNPSGRCLEDFRIFFFYNVIEMLKFKVNITVKIKEKCTHLCSQTLLVADKIFMLLSHKFLFICNLILT